MNAQFLLLHGWKGNGPNHWQTHLAETLTEKGHKVSYPKFPTPNTPQLEEWLTTLSNELATFSPQDRLIIITHSLGGTLWMHYLDRHPETHPFKTFLIAPPLETDHPEVQNFFPLPKLSPHRLGNEDTLMVGSDNDHYIPLEQFHALEKEFSLTFKLMPKLGHISTSSQFLEWITSQCLSIAESHE